MATREEAQLAKQELLRLLEGESWLRGIGLGGDRPDYSVQVNVSGLTPEIARKIPKQVLDVEVNVSEVGDIAPQAL